MEVEMRGSRISLLVAGALTIVLGGVLAYEGFTADGPENVGFKIGGFTCLAVGIVLVLSAQYVARLDTSATLKSGVPGTAQVLFTQDTGVVVGNVNLVVRVGL